MLFLSDVKLAATFPRFTDDTEEVGATEGIGFGVGLLLRKEDNTGFHVVHATQGKEVVFDLPTPEGFVALEKAAERKRCRFLHLTQPLQQVVNGFFSATLPLYE